MKVEIFVSDKSGAIVKWYQELDSDKIPDIGVLLSMAGTEGEVTINRID